MALQDVGNRFSVSGVLPPLAGGLARPRDHRRKQDELLHRSARSHQRPRECSERLGDYNEASLARHRVSYGVGMIAGVGVLVPKRKRRCKGAVAKRVQDSDRLPVDARIDPRAGNQDEGGHPASLARPVARLALCHETTTRGNRAAPLEPCCSSSRIVAETHLIDAADHPIV